LRGGRVKQKSEVGLRKREKKSEKKGTSQVAECKIGKPRLPEKSRLSPRGGKKISSGVAKGELGEKTESKLIHPREKSQRMPYTISTKEDKYVGAQPASKEKENSRR